VKALSIALLLASSLTAVAGDKPDDFKSIVKQVEQHYGKARMKVPLMGLVSFASHFTRPLGASDFKLAVIEGVDSRSESLPEFNPGREWKPVIRTTSRNGEHVVIFGRDEGRAVRTLVVTVGGDDAVVMQMRLDPGHFAKMLNDRSFIDMSIGDRSRSHFEY
jgi:hypothetical protein